MLQKGHSVEQLLIHLWGDYVTQTDWMAQQKTKSHIPALAHAVTYSLPFLLLTTSPLALFVICFSHFVIDRWRLARYVVFAKNLVTNPEYKWADCNATGYHKDSPPWLAFWLLIIADNTLHLTINYFAIGWL
jgi:hypothetical protein